MKAVVYTRYGSPDVLQLKDIAKPSPKNNEILIKMFAATVTSGDVRLRKADPPLVRAFNGFNTPKKPVLGAEFSGEVEAVGKDVKLFNIGDHVFGSTGFDLGTYAEYLCIHEDKAVALKPSNLSFEEAAAIPFGFLTSLHFLRKGHIKKGDKLLIYGASGSLGTAAVQLASHFGAEITAVCSTQNIELVKSLGAHHVIDYSNEDLPADSAVYDIIFDTVGKSPFSQCVKLLKANGFYLRAVHLAPSVLIKGLWTSLTGRKKIVAGVSVETKEGLIFLKELFEAGKLKPVIDKRYPLERIGEAHLYVDQGHKKGNVVINIR